MAEDQIVCIVGSHRGGTSVITRVLHLLGVHLGSSETMPPARFDNATGFWEQTPIVMLNDEVLRRLGGAWDRPPHAQTGWEGADSVEDLIEKGRTVIAEVLGTEGLRGFKDPRTSLLIPFWRRVAGDMKYVICIRHPSEVQQSLSVRDGFSAQRGYSLWAAYTATTLLDTPTDQRLLLHYDELFSGDSAVKKIADFIGVAEPSTATLHEIARAIRPDLRHQHFNDDSASRAPASVLTLYHALVSSVGNEGAARSALIRSAAEAALEWSRSAATVSVKEQERLIELEAKCEALTTELTYMKALVDNLKAEVRRASLGVKHVKRQV